MSLNDVVSAERLHIGFFGLRNAGKSSVVNAVTGQEMSLVSDYKGTTTDPVMMTWSADSYLSVGVLVQGQSGARETAGVHQAAVVAACPMAWESSV